jgi:hypothetical protein
MRDSSLSKTMEYFVSWHSSARKDGLSEFQRSLRNRDFARSIRTSGTRRWQRRHILRAAEECARRHSTGMARWEMTSRLWSASKLAKTAADNQGRCPLRIKGRAMTLFNGDWHSARSSASASLVVTRPIA